MRFGATTFAAAGLLAAFPAGAQTLSQPTVLERVETKLQQQPALRKLVDAPPAPLEAAKWMTGTWDVTLRTFATAKTPEKVKKGTGVTAFELDGRWLVTRIGVPAAGASERPEENVQYLGFDPWRKKWYFMVFTSFGRGTNVPLTSDRGWEGDRLMLTGTMYFWGEPADITLRVQKVSDNEYIAVFEERVVGNVVRAVVEHTYKRRAPAAAEKKAP